MCVVPLKRLSLDQLALLATHPRSTPTVQAQFSTALITWTRDLVKHLGKGLSADERDELVAAFMLDCLTTHLVEWRSHRSAMTTFLFGRLYHDVVDAQRACFREIERSRDAFAADDLEDESVSRQRTAVVREAQFRLIEGGLPGLPSRQRDVIKGCLAGQSISEVAAELGVHPSTMSREHGRAVASLRALATNAKAA